MEIMIKFFKLIILTLGISLITTQISYACDCTYAGKFDKFSKGQTVIRGKIKSHGSKLNHGKTLHATMKVSVSELIKGSYPNQSVVFMGDPGHLCLTYVDSNQYQIGSEHLFVLFNEDEKQGLAGCGEVSVSISNGKIHGTSFSDKKLVNYSTNYDRFIKSIKD